MTPQKRYEVDRETVEALLEERERLRALLRQAAQLADIAADWNLPEVEIDDEWISTRSLAEQFNSAAAGGI